MKMLTKTGPWLLITRKQNRWIIAIAFALAGFAAPFLYASIDGFPIPRAHDEFAYLLSADTYAHGRLTNPSPPAWKNFEAPHVLVRPSYMSKYPPMQGMFLAAGQILFGNPTFGVWLSCSFMAVTLFWMLCGWTRQIWAVVGTVLAILFLGIFHYWAQSFWGGMVAASGGALFFGGFGRILKRPSIASSLLMTAGGVILVNSRPFEGTVMMLPPMAVLAHRLVFDRRYKIGQKSLKVVLPVASVTFIALSLMAYNNFRVTGNAVKFAYTEHQAQYFSTPLFIFQSPTEPFLNENDRLRKLSEYLHTPGPIKSIETFGLPDLVYLRPIYAFIYLSIFLPSLLFSPALGLFFFVSVVLGIQSKRIRLIPFTIASTFLGMSFVSYWDQPHYAAPLTSCIFLLLVEGFRRFIASGKTVQHRVMMIAMIASLLTASLGFQVHLTNAEKPRHDTQTEIDIERSAILTAPPTGAYLRTIVQRAVSEKPGSYLAMVTYDPDYRIHDDVVYNSADLDGSKLIWANDLGEEGNAELLSVYRNRRVIRIRLSNSAVEIRPEN